MNIKKMLSKQYWYLNEKKFYELWNYDLQFNASFREKDKLTLREKRSKEMKCVKYYRHCQAAKGTIWFFLWFYKLKKYCLKTGMSLHCNLNIGKGLIIGHAGTIVVNSDAKFGNNILLTHGVTIGRDVRGIRRGAPVIGNNVCIRANSTVVGNIVIGDDVLIAPNSFVNVDVPSHSVVIGNPAQIHAKERATQGHLGVVE